MQTRRFAVKILTLCSTLIMLSHLIGSDTVHFPACDNDNNHWSIDFCFNIQGGVRTTIIATRSDSVRPMHFSDSSLSYILFDNKLDRDGVIIFSSQPEYWHRRGSHDTTAMWGGDRSALNDSVAIWLPFPDIPSGLYRFELKSGDSVFTERMVIMQ